MPGERLRPWVKVERGSERSRFAGDCGGERMRRGMLAAFGLMAVATVGWSAEAKEGRALAPLVRVLAASDDVAVQRDVLRGMCEALQGRRNVAAPAGWAAAYRKLASSPNREVREKALVLGLLFGDAQALTALRGTVTDTR